jgi:hypothetical protein
MAKLGPSKEFLLASCHIFDNLTKHTYTRVLLLVQEGGGGPVIHTVLSVQVSLVIRSKKGGGGLVIRIYEKAKVSVQTEDVWITNLAEGSCYRYMRRWLHIPCWERNFMSGSTWSRERHVHGREGRWVRLHVADAHQARKIILVDLKCLNEWWKWNRPN